jgi:hypothetical protein
MTAAAMVIPEMSPAGNGSSIDPSLAAALVPIKRGRGRPRNDDLTYKPASIKKWYPKKWKPIHEEIVALDCAGAPHAMIAAKLNKTVQYVSKICNTPQAKIIRRNALNQLVAKNKEFQEERFEHVLIKAQERVVDFMEDDALFQAEPFQVVDKAMKLLQGRGVLGQKETGNTHIHAKNVTVNNLKQTAIVELKDGLARALEAREKYQELEAIDVTSPKVETGRME